MQRSRHGCEETVCIRLRMSDTTLPTTGPQIREVRDASTAAPKHLTAARAARGVRIARETIDSCPDGSLRTNRHS